MDYEYFFIRMIGWAPALLIMLFGVVLAVRNKFLSHRGRWCLAAAIAVQSANMLTLPMAKHAANRMMSAPAIAWNQVIEDHSPRPSNSSTPPAMEDRFYFSDLPTADQLARPNTGRVLFGMFLCPSHLTQEQLDQQWSQYREKRWKWTLWDVLPDSLLTALTWGLILIAAFDRPAPPKFLAEGSRHREVVG
jgi:hypothetical protein